MIEPSTTRICESCGIWQIQEAFDRYCGWCGSPVLEISLLRADGTPLPPDRMLDYLTPGQRELVYLIRQSGSAARLEPQATRWPDGKPCAVEPTDEPSLFRLRIPWTERGSLARPSVCQIELRCGPTAPRRIELEIWPAPVLEIRRGDDLQQADGEWLEAAFSQAGAETEQLRLRLAAATAPVIPTRVGLKLAGAEPEWDIEGAVETEELAVRLPDLGREIAPEQEITLLLGRRQPWPRGRRMALVLLVGLEGLPPKELSLRLVQRRRTGGDLQPEVATFDTVYRGRMATCQAHLSNGDDFELVVRRVECNPAWLSVAEYDEHSRRPEELRPLPLPVRLAPAEGDRRPEGIDMTVRVDTSHPAFPPAGARALTGRVRFLLGGEQARERDYSVYIGQVSEPRSLADKGYLAVDFGTTNTCCAIHFAGKEVEIVPFDKGGNTSIPSVIFFEDVSNPAAPRYFIGQRALAQAKAHSDRPLVYHFKRRIGLDRKEQVTDRRGRRAAYLPEELAAFYLAEVLREVREHLADRGQVVEIDRVYFTYPVLFSRRQIEILQRTFAGLGVVEAEAALDEASAGAIEYIHRWAHQQLSALQASAEPLPGPRTDYVLNYDFGGGTIDIALLELNKDFAGGQVGFAPVGITGLYRFGGEDITVLVRELIVWRITERIRPRQPGFSLPSGDPTHPPGLYDQKKQNNARLHFLADALKLDVFNYGEAILLPADPRLDGLWIDRGDGAGLVAVEADSNPLFGGLDEEAARIVLTRGELEQLIRPDVASSIERARDLWRATAERQPLARLERVLLTGRSSSIQLVRELMASTLAIDPDRIVHEPQRAKEVVAEGACYYRRLSNIQRGGLVFSTAAELHSLLLYPIGIEMTDFAETVFHPLFEHGARLELHSGDNGVTHYFAEVSETFPLTGRVLSVQLYRSLDYTAPIHSGGKDLIARFELRRSDPFFSELDSAALHHLQVRIQLWRSLDGAREWLQMIVRRPGDSAEQMYRAEVTDLAAIVAEEEQAGGLLADRLGKQLGGPGGYP